MPKALVSHYGKLHATILIDKLHLKKHKIKRWTKQATPAHDVLFPSNQVAG